MGDLARDVLIRMPARDVIHYSRSPALTNLMHGQVPATIPKLLWLTLLSICIHPNGWYNYLILTKGRDSAYCTWIMHVDTGISVLWHVLVFFSKIPAPKRESCGKWDNHWARENEISWCIVIAVDVCNTRGHSVSCKMPRKSCKSHVVFFSHRDIQCGK